MSNERRLRRALSRFRRELGPEIAIAVRRLGQRWDSAMQKRLRSAGDRKRAGLSLGPEVQSRTGRLARSLFSELSGRPSPGGIDGVSLAFGSRMPGVTNYARVLELGAGQSVGGKLPLIRPRRSKYLAIPLPGAFTGASGQKTSDSRRPGDFPEGFFYRSRRGNLLFARRGRGRGRGDLENLFVLKKSVAIPPQLGMRETMRRTLEAHRRREFVDAIEHAARSAFS